MGQKVSPISFRTGVTIGWKSRWFAPKANYGEFLIEDERIRRFIDERLNRQPPFAAISDMEIERTREELKVIIKTARPGLVIGPKGAEVEKLKNALEDMTNRRVNINIVEIRQPDLDAKLVAEGIASQLKRRASFRRTMKQRAETAMQAGAKGVKIIISGRLGGAEMSRSEPLIMGSIPLHTLEADVDYGFAASYTTYGTIGVKVWIYKGLFGEAPTEEEQAQAAAMTRARRRRERGPGGPGGGPGGGGRRGGGDRGGPGAGPGTGGAGARPGGSRLGGRRRAPAEAPAAPAAEPAAPEVQPDGGSEAEKSES
ncbi:MAG: 30S ribosomal protein S3 [Phycisphaerae bacterium]|jgi:small subunit ribosomal protein S3